MRPPSLPSPASRVRRITPSATPPDLTASDQPRHHRPGIGECNPTAGVSVARSGPMSANHATGTGSKPMSASGMPRAAIHGHIAARIDRLPLTRVQWHLAILVEITWGFIIFDTDGIGARLYPFVWRPNHIIDVVPVRGDPGAAGRRRHPARRLHHELGRRSLRPPPGHPARDAARRPLHLAVRLRHQFLGHGRAVGAQHAWRRRHRRDALGVSVRNDLARWCATRCCWPRRASPRWSPSASTCWPSG